MSIPPHLYGNTDYCQIEMLWEIGDTVLVDRTFQSKGKYYHTIYEAEVVTLSPKGGYVKIKHGQSDRSYWILSSDIKERLGEIK